MKKLLILSLATLFTLQVFGQKLTFSPTWKVQKWGVFVGKDLDMLPNIGHDYFLGSARNLNTDRYDNLNVTPQDMYGAVCENPDIRLELTLLPPGMKNTELNLALSAMFNRVDGAFYATDDWGSTDHQTLNFHSHSNEGALEATIRKRANLFGIFNFYGGAGTNIGVSYGGTVSVDGTNIPVDNDGNMIGIRGEAPDSGAFFPPIETDTHFYDNFDMKNALHQRIFAHAGVGILFFKRIEIGLEGKYGIGYRYFGKDNFSRSVLQSIGLTCRYVMK